MKARPYWRLFDDRVGLPRTLFHGLRGRRLLSRDVWLTAEEKSVTDGSGRRYESGFHILPTREQAVRTLRHFRHKGRLAVCRVWVDEDAGVRPKDRARHGVVLARRMLISNKDWVRRERATGCQ